MKDWHHAPLHQLGEAGAYMVTAGTYLRERFFNTPKRLDMLQEVFFDAVRRYDWLLQSWSHFSNHYHFVGNSDTPDSLSKMIGEFHSGATRELNRMDGTPGRKIWFQYWDTHLTYQGSYLARLRYVNENPVHHGIVDNAQNYRWCSASWFACNASNAFYRAVANIKTDRVNVIDDFDLECGAHGAALGAGKQP